MKSILRISVLVFFLSFSFLSVFAQSGVIQGTVKGENGVGLIGATILITNATGGAITTDGGNYSIKAAPGTYNLEYKYFGFVSEKRNVVVSDGATITVNVTLKEDESRLKEVVAIGYGSKIKEDVTGNIASVKGKELADLPTQSFEAGLQGKVVGLQVISGGGLAGSPNLIRVRGVASVSASGDPLYVIDGVPVNQDYFARGNNGATNFNPLAAINPLDIESVDILKDAAATAIYGARGSNGVILITTKTAKQPGWNFEVNTRVATSQATFLPEMLNSEQWLQLRQEAWENDGNTGQADLPRGMTWDEARANDNDWVDLLTHVGIKQTYSASAGYKDTTNKWSAFVSLAHDNNQSYIIDNRYIRNSVRLNADWEPIKDFKIKLNSSYSKGTNFRVYNGWSGGLGAAMSTALPIYPLYDSTGDYNLNYVNPVATRELLDWKTFENRTVNSLDFTYKISDKLSITAFGGIDYSGIIDDVFLPQKLLFSDHSGQSDRFVVDNTTSTFNGRANYKVVDTDRHYFGVLAGVERVLSKTKKLNHFADSTTGAFYTNEEEFAASDSGLLTYDYWAINSAFSRLSYSLDKKYLADVTLRTDGSSKFGPNNRYGFFPAVGLGWILTGEDFMRRFPSINFAKLKVGYGISGNVPIEENAFRQVFIGASNGIAYGGQPTVYPTNHENNDLQWENSNILDVSFEIAAFRNRITAELAFYDKLTTDILLNLSTPVSTGFSQFWANTGKFRNSGLEFAITSKNIVKPEFWWETQFNISRNWNKVIDLGIYFQDALSGGTNDTRVVVGEPLGTNYLVVFSRVDPATGRPIYLDADGNETYTWDNDNRVATGSVLPDAFGALVNNFKFKNFYLATNIYYKIGGNIYNSSAKRQNGVVTDWNMTTDYFDRWTSTNNSGKYPKLSLDETNEYGLPGDPYQYNSTLFLEDGSFLRLRNISLSYALPSKLFADRQIKSVTVGFAAFNALTLTNYTGGDPEIARDFENAADRNMSSNITWLSSPQEKSYSLNLNIKF